MNAIMRGIGMATRLAPRIARGIGTASRVSRGIGEALNTARTIGQSLNNASGGRLQNSNLYNKAMEVAGKVEEGAKSGSNTLQRVSDAIY